MSGLHVDILGAGPPLVLLHGWAMHGGIFRPLAERLAAHHTLHLIDLPGHGGSRGLDAAFTVAACVDELLARLPPAPWLGWSLGGLVALTAAARDPGAVPALVLLCASPRFVKSDDWPHGVEAELFRAFGRDLGSDYRRTIDRFLALETHGSDCMRAELRELRAHVFDRGEPAPAVLVDGLDVLERTDLRASLPTLAVPALWLAGRRDRLVPWQAMQAAAAAMPHGRFQRIEGGGHAPFLGHPDEVAAAVTDFLATAGAAKSFP